MPFCLASNPDQLPLVQRERSTLQVRPARRAVPHPEVQRVGVVVAAEDDVVVPYGGG